MKVTADQVKQATIDAGIDIIPSHNCCLCGVVVFFFREEEKLYFSSSCNCCESEHRTSSWEEVAKWINIQTNEEQAQKIAKKFGL